METYKALKEFTRNEGEEKIQVAIGDLVSMETEQAEELVANGTLELFVEPPKEPGDEAQEGDEKKEEGKISAPLAVEVLNVEGKVVKKFTPETSGPEFVELAKKFAVDNGFTVNFL